MLQDCLLTLPDGRILAYEQSGNLEGKPLFLFHGLASSRHEVNLAHDEMLKANIRFIGIDRPGMGLSTFQKNRTIIDFVKDVEFLADYLSIERFSIMGISTGASYAYACIHKIPHRIVSCDIISGIGPIEELGYKDLSSDSRMTIKVAKYAPWLMRPLFWFTQGRFSQKEAYTDKFLDSITFMLDDVDKKLIQDKRMKRELIKPFRESYRQGSKGVARDGVLAFAKPWGFKLKDVGYFPIYLWHGEKDKGIPAEIARKVDKKLKNSKLTLFPNEGHISIIFNRFEEIAKELLKNMAVGIDSYRSQYCEVLYLENEKAVFCKWKSFCRDDAYREPLKFGLKLINIKQSKVWITDATDGFLNEEKDTQWLLNRFMPKAIESSMEKIVFIVNDNAQLKKEIASQTESLSEFFQIEIVSR